MSIASAKEEEACYHTNTEAEHPTNEIELQQEYFPCTQDANNPRSENPHKLVPW